MTWTPEIVFARFIEAADTEWRSPRAMLGPRPAPAFWPEYVHTDADRRGWGRQPGHQLMPGDNPLEEMSKTKVSRVLPSAEALSRMEEALFWSVDMLNDRQRRVLWGKCFCIVSGEKFSRWCRRNGIVRMTAYRDFNNALERISATLLNNDVLLRLPDAKHVLQIALPGDTNPVMLGGSAGEIAEAA